MSTSVEGTAVGEWSSSTTGSASGRKSRSLGPNWLTCFEGARNGGSSHSTLHSDSGKSQHTTWLPGPGACTGCLHWLPAFPDVVLCLTVNPSTRLFSFRDDPVWPPTTTRGPGATVPEDTSSPRTHRTEALPGITDSLHSRVFTEDDALYVYSSPRLRGRHRRRRHDPDRSRYNPPRGTRAGWPEVTQYLPLTTHRPRVKKRRRYDVPEPVRGRRHPEPKTWTCEPSSLLH